MSVHSTLSRQVKVAAVIVGVVGVWGALIPFVGPSFGYGMGTSQAWQWTESHLTLHLAPGLAAILGAGLLTRRRRAVQTFGALLGLAGGAWFVIAPSLHPLWAGGMSGMSMGSSALSGALSALGYHYGTGAVITIAAAYAFGALSSTPTAASSLRSDASDLDRPAPSPDASRSRVGVRT